MGEVFRIQMSAFIKDFQEMCRGTHPQRFCFVLGAGASISSGIRSGQKLVAIWEDYLKDRYGAAHEEWKQQNGITPENRAEFYSRYYKRRFPDPESGYSFMEEEMEKAVPSGGYAAMAYILCNTDNHIVLTTNFDHLVEDAVNRQQRILPVVLGHESLAHYVTYYLKKQIRRPIIIKIHRDLLMEPMNTEDLVEELKSLWEEPLDALFTNYHPVFIGYAGNDKSLMDYLINNSRKFRDNSWKLPYWTLYGEDEQLRGKAKEFMEHSGGFVVPGCDFDELMIRLGDALNFRLKTEEETVNAAKAEYAAIRQHFVKVLTKKLPPESAAKSAASGDGKPDEAAAAAPEQLNKAIDRITGDTESSGARYRQAVTAFNKGKFTEAEQLLRQLTVEEPDNAEYHQQLGVTLHEMRRYEEAEAEKRRAVELEPDNAEYHKSLGATLHAMRRYEEAEAEKRRAVELEPDNAWYHYSLGVTLHEMRRYEEAEAEKRRAVELEPDNAEYHQQLGVTLHAMRRYEEAEAESRRAVELEPDNAMYHASLGVTLQWMNRYSESESELRRAVELEPDNAKYHKSLGVTLHAMRRFKEAEAEKRRAVELEPDNAEYYESLAITLRARNKRKEARQAKAKAAELRKR